MALYKHVRDDVSKLTYIDRTEFTRAIFKMFYTSDGVVKVKTLPYRATKNQLLAALEFIRNDSDYYIIEAEKYARGDYDVANKKMVVASSGEER